MNKFKNYVLAILTLTCGLSTFSLATLSTAVYAAPATPTQTACSALGSASCKDTSGGPSLDKIVSSVVNVLSLVIGIIAVIMVIIGGLRYVTSNGDSNAISSARSTIIYAIVGLVIAAMAQLLVQFVLKKIT